MSGNNKICSIICGSPDGSIDRSQVEGLVICADSGLHHAIAAGIAPDIVVGDFDSCTADIPESAEVIRVSPIKDDTDTILAADTAIQHGCKELRFFCALGGRFDHAFANVQTLEYLHQKGVNATLYGSGEKLRLLHQGDSVKIGKFDGFVSLFAFTETSTVTEYGMKYPLVRYRLDRAYPLGISNEVAEAEAEVIVHSGAVILYEFFS